MKREGDSYRVGNFVYERRRRELVVGLEHLLLETLRVRGIWDGVGLTHRYEDVNDTFETLF